MKYPLKAGWLSACLVSTLALPPTVTTAQTTADLGAAETFIILGGSAVTSTGATIINGDLGVSPGTSITGFPPGLVVNGSIFNNVPPATTAHNDTITAFNLFAGLPSSANLTTIDLGGLTLTPGVYTFASSAGLTGTLTLDNTADPTGAFVFQIGTGLTTATNSAVILLGGPNPNVFWQIGSSATIGTGTAFEGNILAQTSITFDPGATLTTGRALSINGAVTLSGGNSINLNGLGLPIVPVGAFWNGDVDNRWSQANWSPDTTGVVNGTLSTGADVVFSITGAPPATNQNTNLDFNALISSLTVNDTVNVSISGANTLTILGQPGALSTLTLNDGAGLVTINSNVVLGGATQTVTVDNNAGLVMNGTVNGLIGLTKEGDGNLTLNGANGYTGGTLINEGPLTVGNANALSNGAVVNNATLQTTATTGGGIETINVRDNYTQNNSGTLRIEVASTPAPTPSSNAGTAGINYDTVNVTGSALLSGTLNLNFDPASVPSQGQQYVALTAGAPLTTPFTLSTTTNLNPDFFTVTTYNDTFNGSQPANSAIVTLLRPFATLRPLTPNQVRVARYVDNSVAFMNDNGLFAFPTGANADFLNNIVMGLTTASTSAHSLGLALNELSPQRFEILHNLAFDNYAFEVQSLDEHLARARRGRGGVDSSGFVVMDANLDLRMSHVKSRLQAWSPPPESILLADSSPAIYRENSMSDSPGNSPTQVVSEVPVKPWNFFVDGGAQFGDLEDNADADDSSFITGRARVGLDYLIAENLRLGALMAFSHSAVDLDGEGSEAEVQGYTPGIYMGYGGKQGFYANMLLTYTRNEYETERRIVIPGVDRTADGTTSGNQYGGNIDAGYEFRRGGWLFGPNVGLSYVNLNIDRFTETGAGVASLNVHDQSVDSLRSRLGGTVSYQAKVGSVGLTPHMSAFWQHEFLNESDNIAASFVGLPAATGNFAIETRGGDRDTALLSVGLDADLNETVTLFINYGSVLGGDTFFGQSATGGVRLNF
jgi:autotransporter-associated beta strand protein